MLLFLLMLLGVITPTISLAQKSDGFFRYNEVIYENRDGENGITIGNMQNDNPIPLGSGLLILTAVGVGYAITRRKRNIKNGATLLIAALMLLGLTHCKKNDIATIPDGDTVFMTLEASCGGGRTIFDPSVPGIRWSADAKEYIYVGSSVNGYLGELSGKSNVSTPATNRLSFSGTIQAPAGTEGEKFYFFYLGNGRHNEATSLDFSNQEDSAGTDFVTDYVVAIGEGTVTNSGTTYTATADLEVKTAIAYFNDDEFYTGSSYDNVYLRGNDVYSTATIDYKAGTIIGNTKGSINTGLAFYRKYIALIPSVSTETTLIFEGATKEGTMTFLRGIQANRYYSNDGEALEITGTDSYVFTVSDYPAQKVRFSPGNLQYNCSTSQWRFAENQYDVCQTTNGTWNTSGWVDLFGWGTWSGTSEQWNPTNTSNNNHGYSWNGDYGDVYFHGTLTNHTATGWFTLSRDQWQYIIEHSYYGLATITVGGNNIHGMIILPDNFVLYEMSWPYYYTDESLMFNVRHSNWDDNKYSESQWAEKLESKGAVFLPAADFRTGVYVDYGNGSECLYWSSSECTSTTAYRLDGWQGETEISDVNRNMGYSVRLVR